MVYRIPLRGKYGAGKFAIVDDEDRELVQGYAWYAHNVAPKGRPLRLYARATWKENGRSKHLYMHHLVTGRKGIDHRDHDGFNNRRSNLREATNRQNIANKRSKWTARYLKGTFPARPGSTRWVAYIRPNGRKRHLGTFDSEADAARAYDAAAIEAFGEFACLNFPEEHGR